MKNITILIPCYNEVKFIEKAILSAVSQAEFVLVSDNNSTDGTREICRELAKKYKNLQLFEQSENIGGHKNGLFLCNYIKTDYVSSMGAHDILDANYIYELKKCLDQNSDAIMAFSPCVRIDDDDIIIDTNKLDYFTENVTSENIFKRIIGTITMDYNYACFGLFKSKYLLKNITHTEAPGIDHLFMTKCVSDGKFVRSLNTNYNLRVITREETPEAYMKRLTGNANSIFDMTYTCINLLKIIDNLSDVKKEEKVLFFELARKFLQNKYAKSCQVYIETKLKKLKNSGKKFILYNDGRDHEFYIQSLDMVIYEYVIKTLNDSIIYLIDKDEKKHYIYKDLVTTYNISKLNEYEDIEIIIISVGNAENIITDLTTNYSVNPNRLISLDIALD